MMMKIRRFALLFLIDSVLIVGSVIFSYFLRFGGLVPTRYFPGEINSLLIIYPLVFASYYFGKLYRQAWNYAGVLELIQIIKSTSVGLALSGFVYLVMDYYFHIPEIPFSIFLISWMVMILGVGGSRFIWRIRQDQFVKLKPHHRKALIVGAGKAGLVVARELTHAKDSEVYPIGFIDDDPNKLGLVLSGIPVVGSREDIANIINEKNIEAVIIAMPSAPKAQVAEIIELCNQTKVKVKILPRVSDLILGKVTINSFRDVNVEDLLGREPIDVNLEEIAGYVTDKVVLVTGAGGSIGSEICRQIAEFNPNRLLLLGHGENSIYAIQNELKRNFPDLNILSIIADIQDRKRIDWVFKTYQPKVVFHAAAHKHVPLMEENPTEAIKNNVFGSRNVAECAHLYHAERFVLISTDKAVNPTNVMGATKRVTEMIIQSLDQISDTKFVAVRFGNVLGSRGSVIPLFKQQIKDGGPVTVTHPEMVRYFMTIPEAAQLVIQAGAYAKGGEIFILDMGDPVKIADLARNLIQLSGFELDKDISIEYSGIRPGEKLYEELLTAEEGITATKHNRIFIGKPIEFSKETLDLILTRFEQVIFHQEQQAESDVIKEMLYQIVPTYSGYKGKEKLGVMENNLVENKDLVGTII